MLCGGLSFARGRNSAEPVYILRSSMVRKKVIRTHSTTTEFIDAENTGVKDRAPRQPGKEWMDALVFRKTSSAKKSSHGLASFAAAGYCHAVFLFRVDFRGSRKLRSVSRQKKVGGGKLTRVRRRLKLERGFKSQIPIT